MSHPSAIAPEANRVLAQATAGSAGPSASILLPEALANALHRGPRVDPNPPHRVLIVDDDAVHRRLACEILRLPKFCVAEAPDGTTALAMLAGAEYDVVLLDKIMPAPDGDEVCRQIRERLGLTLLPIVMVTGSTSHDDLAASLNAGANDFLRKPYAPGELVARVASAAQLKRLTDQMEHIEAMLYSLARMVEAKDETTGDHCARLVHFSEIFGTALRLPSEELLALRRGAILHDIGKIGIPDDIVRKPGVLTRAEWAVMREHPRIGAELCSALKSLRLSLPVIRSHHEHWDGSGYPDGLRGDAIPFLAQVFQLLDVFDALTSVRPYKPAWSMEQALAAIGQETARGHFNPELSAVFTDIVGRRPELFSGPDIPGAAT